MEKYKSAINNLLRNVNDHIFIVNHSRPIYDCINEDPYIYKWDHDKD